MLEVFDVRLWGFVTPEIVETGRAGFEIATFNGFKVPFAHVDMTRGPQVGPYRVDIEAFETTALPALDRPHTGPHVGVVDEVGKMACFSRAFRERVDLLLREPGCLLMTVAHQGDGLIQEIHNFAGEDLLEVDENNRKALPDRITTLFLEAFDLA
jgi:nucleoside-triphosphatase THEP1